MRRLPRTPRRLRRIERLPDRGFRENSAQLTARAARAATFFRRFSEDLVAIEQHVGFTFEIPDHFERTDIDAIANAASWLRGEEGHATVTSMTLTFAPSELAQNVDALAAGQAVATLPVEQTIFGRDVPIGLIEIQLPPMKVVETQPSLDPVGAVRVRVAAATKDASRPFKLVSTTARVSRVYVPPARIHVARAAPLLAVAEPGETLAALGRQRRSAPRAT